VRVGKSFAALLVSVSLFMALVPASASVCDASRSCPQRCLCCTPSRTTPPIKPSNDKIHAPAQVALITRIDIDQPDFLASGESNGVLPCEVEFCSQPAAGDLAIRAADHSRITDHLAITVTTSVLATPPSQSLGVNWRLPMFEISALGPQRLSLRI